MIRSCVQLACVDEFLDQAQVHNSVFLGVGLVEATLRQTLVERHLAAFVAIDRYTGTGLLTFDTTATHFTFAGTRTTANAGPFLGLHLGCRAVH